MFDLDTILGGYVVGKWLTIALCLTSFIMVVPGCSYKQPQGNNQQGKVEITDMVGRKVVVPREIKKIYAPIYGTVILNAVVPEKMIKMDNKPGTPPGPQPGNQPGNPPAGAAQSGGQSGTPPQGDQGGKPGNDRYKKILEAGPDIIVANTQIDMDIAATVADADKLQNQLGIPVVVIDNRLAELAKTYDFLGELLREKEKTKVLADYCRKTFAEVKAAVDKIPAEKRARVYYAEGPKGLATDPAVTRHTEVLDFVGAVNVAQVPSRTGPGQTPVTIEQVQGWNPDVIIANRLKADDSKTLLETVIDDPEWQNIIAVKDRRVYDIPKQVNNWFDRPPSANRVIGVKWLAHLLYPDVVKYDMKKETKQFYKLFYHQELTDQEVEMILNDSEQK